MKKLLPSFGDYEGIISGMEGNDGYGGYFFNTMGKNVKKKSRCIEREGFSDVLYLE